MESFKKLMMDADQLEKQHQQKREVLITGMYRVAMMMHEDAQICVQTLESDWYEVHAEGPPQTLNSHAPHTQGLCTPSTRAGGARSTASTRCRAACAG